MGGIAAALAGHVHDQHAAPAQVAMGVVVDIRLQQRAGHALGTEGVDQQHVAACRRVLDPAHAVAGHDAKALVVGRHAEQRAQGDHMRVDLQRGEVGRGQVAVAEVGQRAAAQAEHGDPPRARVEEQEGHHALGVGQHQRRRVVDVHHALHVAEAEVQRAQAAVLEHEGFVVAALEQIGSERRGVAAGRLEQAHETGFGREGAGQLEKRGHGIGQAETGCGSEVAWSGVARSGCVGLAWALASLPIAWRRINAARLSVRRRGQSRSRSPKQRRRCPG